jgi:cytidine deaminase
VISPSQAAALIRKAGRARSRAYAPYSQFRVGAAILTANGSVFAGCNVENATYGATICAERSAAVAMVLAGHRDPVACAVVTAGPSPATPCGICRQFLTEFARDMDIVLASVDDRGRIVTQRRTRLATLFPSAFRFDPVAAEAPLPKTGGRSPRATGRSLRKRVIGGT